MSAREQVASLPDRLRLAQQAFESFFARCFWDMRPDLRVGADDLAAIAARLRTYGGREGWSIASRICP